MSKKVILTAKAPQPIGPYSQAIQVPSSANTLYISGQIAYEESLLNNIKTETEAVMKNLGAILEEVGLGYYSIVKTTIFLKNMDDFSNVNEVYGRFFLDEFPARETVQVAKLPKDVNVEISAIAVF